MLIRRTTSADIPAVMDIFEHGRKVQRQTGNLNQWVAGHPRQALVEQDIQQGASYVCVVDENDQQTTVKSGTVIATFAAIEGEDPTYRVMEGGVWLNDAPYVTIHRISTNGKVKGAGQICMEWVLERYNNVRIDTHHMNQPMIHVIEKYGFQYCGIIYIADGTARNAYHYVREPI